MSISNGPETKLPRGPNVSVLLGVSVSLSTATHRGTDEGLGGVLMRKPDGELSACQAWCAVLLGSAGTRYWEVLVGVSVWVDTWQSG